MGYPSHRVATMLKAKVTIVTALMSHCRVRHWSTHVARAIRVASCL
jgi:hypothetical protein